MQEIVKRFEAIHHILIHALLYTCSMIQLFLCSIKKISADDTFPSKSHFFVVYELLYKFCHVSVLYVEELFE